MSEATHDAFGVKLALDGVLILGAQNAPSVDSSGIEFVLNVRWGSAKSDATSRPFPETLNSAVTAAYTAGALQWVVQQTGRNS